MEKRLGHGRILLITLGVSLVVGGLYSYPLVRHFRTGIPASWRTPARRRVVTMIPGDHLQLLYYFRLFDSMLGGETPWFCNLYEFNAGDDAERYEPGSYFFPFSLFFAAAERLGGAALGWNLTGFVSVWLTAYLIWLLAARYCRDPIVLAVVCVAATAMPYRWMSLLGGSPTGFAMLWVPLVFLGLDRAVRDGSLIGGAAAGLGVLFAAWTDSHVFYFVVLSSPFWCLLVRLHMGSGRPRERGFALRRAAALGAFFAGIAVSYLFSRWTARALAESHQAAGRTLREVSLYAPHAAGLFLRRELGQSNQVYFGCLLLVLLLGGGVLFLVRALRRRDRGTTGPILALGTAFAGIAVVVILSLGPHGLFGTRRLFLAARRWVPYYEMIRQTAKVYCLLPSLAAAALAIAWGSLVPQGPRGRRIGWIVAGLLCLGLIAEYGTWFRPSISLLASRQGAYEAVAQDARDRSATPRAVAVTLWPGDSHYGSLYEYYGLLHGIRMLNGYRPFVSSNYVAEVFMPLESLNQGLLREDQIRMLREMGIDYLLFHEDPVPQKVSPFPQSITLERFLRNPVLEPIARSEEVWAFRIRAGRETPGAGTPGPSGRETCAGYQPLWFLEAENAGGSGGRILESADAARGAFVRLEDAGAKFRGRRLSMAGAPELRWMLRCRGPGRMRIWTLSVAGEAPRAVTIEDADWRWIAIPVGLPEGRFERGRLVVELTDGRFDVDSYFVAAGKETPMEPGEERTEPAACCWHTGETDPETGEVLLRAGRVMEGPALVAIGCPLPVGVYEASVGFGTPAPAGTPVGAIVLEGDGLRADAGLHRYLVAGEPVRLSFEQRMDLPVRLVVHFEGTADLRLRSVRLEMIR